MAEGDLTALDKITSEIDESQINIILSTQCIKAQAFLVDKLKKQAERHKEVCSFISNGNLKLETEINLAQLEFKSLNSALVTIKSANVEVKKELLLAKDRKSQIQERVFNGIKKYQNLWLDSKKKYENIPLVKKYSNVKNKLQTIQESINMLDIKSIDIFNEICKRKNDFAFQDKHKIIQVAQFLINDRPKLIHTINEKYFNLNKIKNNIQERSFQNVIIANTNMEESSDAVISKAENVTVHNKWPTLQNNISKDELQLPELQLQSVDLDILRVKLDQIKKVENSTPMKRMNSLTLLDPPNKRCKTEDTILKDECVSNYFNIGNKIVGTADSTEKKDYSDKKIINILVDIKLNDNETYNIISQVNPMNFQDVKVIRSQKDHNQSIFESNFEHNTDETVEVTETIHANEIEELDITKSQGVVMPPTQFKDSSQEDNKKCSSETEEQISKGQSQAKKVTFVIKEAEGDQIKINDNLEMTTASDESYKQMKDTMMKKHLLDLSPQFVYSKNQLQKKISNNKTDDIVKSNLFDNDPENEKVLGIDDKEREATENNNNKKMETENLIHTQESEIQKPIKTSSPTDDRDLSVSGLLFAHGPSGLPESLNISTSTMDYDGDSDYPQCFDSSLLLSPKATVPNTSDGNTQVLTQEAPNFLSGLRKTGLSFFGKNKEDSDANPNSGFTFSFGGEDKKTRGGFFNMFR